MSGRPASQRSNPDDIERARAVRDRLAAVWLRVPGVVGVAVGGKRTGGRATGQWAVVVGVVKKLPRDQVPAGELIPPTVDGVLT